MKKTPRRQKPAAKEAPAASSTAARTRARKTAPKPPAKKRPAKKRAPAAVPTAEQPPEGLTAYWLGVWRHALKILKEQGTWKWEQRPLLDEYVYALVAAEQARVGFGWLEHLTEVIAADEVQWNILEKIAGGLPTHWDRHTKRAAALAEKLILTPDSQSRLVRTPAPKAESTPTEEAAPSETPYFGNHLRVVES